MRKECLPNRRTAWMLVVLAVPLPLVRQAQLKAQQGAGQIDDISGEYDFISPEDTLAVLDEDGKLKGYIDVIQGQDESDAVLTYDITIGTRQKDHVELKTSKIHEKYYRFSGTAARGSGKKESDPDYLRLVGDLETVTVNGSSGLESIARQHVVFKSKGKEQ
ncbi:MAG TPA: hypothetical protein VGW33_13810 [Terriglobia bacterium]|nr:hypothetical protein [Terriglobia bacterium]